MHILQSPHWYALKTEFGWQGTPVRLPQTSIETHVLYRRLPFGLKIAYVPKGPNLNWQNTTIATEGLQKLVTVARQPGVIFLKIEPDAPAQPDITPMLAKIGFRRGRTIQPPATILVDISPPEAQILARMKSKTRYNIRLAGKKGVTVRTGTAADLPQFQQLMEVTARRDGFGVHSAAYYRAVWRHFPPETRALLIAEFAGEPLAALMVFAWDGTAYYLYGASGDAQRNKLPTYLLQWEAMRWAKAHGCHTYDLWGIPNAPVDELERDFLTRRDGLWGVYRFKRGFGGQAVYSPGAFDWVYSKPLYWAFTTFTALWSKK